MDDSPPGRMKPDGYKSCAALPRQHAGPAIVFDMGKLDFRVVLLVAIIGAQTFVIVSEWSFAREAQQMATDWRHEAERWQGIAIINCLVVPPVADGILRVGRTSRKR